MTARMRMMGLKGFAIAAGLAVAGFAAGGQAAPAVQGATPGQHAAANVPNVSNIAPTTAGATAPAAPGAPELAMDGAPYMPAPAVSQPTEPGTPNVGQPTAGMIDIQPQVTTNGRFAHWFHNAILFPLSTIICLLVLGLLVWVVVRYRQAAHPIPSRTSHNTVVEVIWTLAPVAVLVAIAIPSIGLLQAQFRPAPAGAVTLKAIGNQWYWSYQYPDHGGFEVTANMLKEKVEVAPGERFRTAADGPRLLAADNRVVLPVGVPIRLITTANDVIHSWAMPAFWIKLDAVPGRLNETSFTIQKPGLYFGQCSELCGARHAFMPIAVEAVPPAQFAAWVRAKGGTMPARNADGSPKSSDKVIPQPGANLNPMDKPGDFTVPPAGLNPPTTPLPATPQGATNNRTGAGNAGL